MNLFMMLCIVTTLLATVLEDHGFAAYFVGAQNASHESKCLANDKPCLIYMTGGGSATDEQRSYRLEWLAKNTGYPPEQIVMFKPSGPLYSEKDVQEIRDFINKRRHLGANLNFLVSSAGVEAFENHLWSSLPARIGAVVEAQPFWPGRDQRRVLPAGVRARYFVTFDIAMSRKHQRFYRAGPPKFEDTGQDHFYLVLDMSKYGSKETERGQLKIPKKEAKQRQPKIPNGINLVFNQHPDAVGWSEEIGATFLTPGSIPLVKKLFQGKVDRFGRADLSFSRAGVRSYWTTDFAGNPRGKLFAEADIMSNMVQSASRVLIVGQGPGARRMYDNVKARRGIDNVRWIQDHLEKDEAEKLAESLGFDAVLGVELTEQEGESTAKRSDKAPNGHAVRMPMGKGDRGDRGGSPRRQPGPERSQDRPRGTTDTKPGGVLVDIRIREGDFTKMKKRRQ